MDSHFKFSQISLLINYVIKPYSVDYFQKILSLFLDQQKTFWEIFLKKNLLLSK